MKNRIPLCLILMVALLYILDQVTKWSIVLNYNSDRLHGFSPDITPVWANAFSPLATRRDLKSFDKAFQAFLSEYSG